MEFDALYNELEREIGRSASLTGQACPPGCGACCRRPSRHIEASTAEMRPLARHLWAEGRAEEVLARAREAGADGWCAVFEPGDGTANLGDRCTAYGFRPLTCRLFGYAAVRDKTGHPRPNLSAVMKDRDPGLVQRIDRLTTEGLRMPVASDWRQRMAEVTPDAAVNLLPLNEALVRALEAEGLAFRLRG
jgi:Fe-S-cluster containining protein